MLKLSHIFRHFSQKFRTHKNPQPHFSTPSPHPYSASSITSQFRPTHPHSASTTTPRSHTTHPCLAIKLLLPFALLALVIAPCLLSTTPVYAACTDDGSGNYVDENNNPCTPEETTDPAEDTEEATPTPANDGCPEGYVKTNLFGDTKDASGNPYTDSKGNSVRCAQTGNAGQGIFNILAIVLNVLTFGVGILATVGIAFSGFQYLTARDNDAVVAKAKMRILEIVIGLVVYALLWTILRFVLPGGIWGNQI